jgi:K+-sensing histidine kinase KdpD
MREFEEYSKPYTRKTGNKESGSGLGLNICIAIMNEHGFTINCEKQEKGGTKIKIKL